MRALGGAPRVAFDFTVIGDVITNIDMVSDEDELAAMQFDYVRREKGE